MKILKKWGFTPINHITNDFYRDAHHTSAKYDKSVSEFDQTQLQASYMNGFQAPFVKDSPVKIAMRYVEEYHIKANDTIMLVGEIDFFQVKSSMLMGRWFSQSC